MSARLKWIWLGAAGLAGYAIYLGARTVIDPTELIFIDVGQGDCALFRTEGLSVMIDAGPKTERFDAGERRVLPELRKRGIRNVDVLFLSHPDMDHIGGLAAISRRVRIGLVCVPSHFRGNPQLTAQLEAAKIPDDRVRWVSGGESLEFGAYSASISVPEWTPDLADNDGSLFVRLSGPGGTAVFTGDAGQETELKMMPGGDWRADVLKAGHHGSNGSSHEDWLKAVAPKWVVFSCGKDNAFGHPHYDVRQRVTASGATGLRTDESGTITFTPSPNGWKLRR